MGDKVQNTGGKCNMNDLIIKSALRDLLYEEDAITMRGLAMLNTFPTVDAVEVVRCKDCKCVSDAIKDEYGNAHLACTMLMGLPVDPTDYCSMGERKENEGI